MKTHLIALTFVIPLLISGCSKESSDEISNAFPYEEEILMDIITPENIDDYEYPITIGSPGWDTLNQQERFEVMQIPDSILKNMSTWGLVETCFNYPPYGNFTVMPDFDSYINDLSFNGLKELFLRTDFIKILLYRYRYLNVKNFENLLKLNFIELIVGCDKHVSQLDQKQSVFLTAVALDKANDQRNNLDISTPFSVYIMGNTMLYANYKPFIDYCAQEKQYVYGGILQKFNSSEEKIEEYARNFIKL